MTESRTYATATSFRRALEERLKQWASNDALVLQRLRRQLAFDRLLCRLFTLDPTPWVLKGGYAMELRTAEARSTKDLDLSVSNAQLLPDGLSELAILGTLQAAAALNASDWFTFLIGKARRDLDGPPCGGWRYPVEARMDGRTFVRFHLDIGIGDATWEPLESIEGRDWLAFAGVPRPRFRMISREQQFAEKLHAYTLPRGEGINSRVKDLVDMILLIKSETMRLDRLSGALAVTFQRRGTHSVPETLMAPPEPWGKAFAVLARECRLSESLDEAFGFLVSYFAKTEQGSFSSRQEED